MEAAASYRDAIAHTGILDVLAPFEPAVAGTAPLELTVDDSDIDILCCSPDPDDLEQTLWEAFGQETDFSLRRWIGAERPVIGLFRAYGWTFQIYGSRVPVNQQIGWTLFQAERRLITIGGKAFKAAILRERERGLKTIPAIAQILRLGGDPYQALLRAAALSDYELGALIAPSLRG